MIVVRAPLRVSFVGGGTDIKAFYKHYQGRVISTTINKYVYVVINKTPLIPKVSARYSISETVDTPDDLKHTRIKTALNDLKINKGIEIASFADLPAKTGLGSSSSFSVALLKGLYAYLGKKMHAEEIAKLACRLEIDLLGEPIGKQDQYASTYGGFNVIEFNNDGSTIVKPVLIDYSKKFFFQKHIIAFYTGITRDASSVLKDQVKNTKNKLDILKKMAEDVDDFKQSLIEGDMKKLGNILHNAWKYKKKLSGNISNNIIDNFYSAGMKSGAWGGKILGAGGGGCILFIALPEYHNEIRQSIIKIAKKYKLADCKEIPFSFVQSGAQILLNTDRF